MGRILVIYPTRKSDNGLYSLYRALMSACVDGTVRLGRSARSRACSHASAHGISGACLPNKYRRPIPARLGSPLRWLIFLNLRPAVNRCRHSSFSQETRIISTCTTVLTILGYIPAKINHNMLKSLLLPPTLAQSLIPFSDSGTPSHHLVVSQCSSEFCFRTQIKIKVLSF